MLMVVEGRRRKIGEESCGHEGERERERERDRPRPLTSLVRRVVGNHKNTDRQCHRSARD